MIEWLWLLFGGPIVALIIRWFIKVPGRPKLLHTPYARPGNAYLYSLMLFPRNFQLRFGLLDASGYWCLWISWFSISHKLTDKFG